MARAGRTEGQVCDGIGAVSQAEDQTPRGAIHFLYILILTVSRLGFDCLPPETQSAARVLKPAVDESQGTVLRGAVVCAIPMT